MIRRGHAGRTDDNHAAVVKALRAMDWLVWSTAMLGSGFPDLLICKAGRMLLLEVKDGRKPPSARKLTPLEIEAHEKFRAKGIQVVTVMSVADLAQLDREARERIEGIGPRDYYPEREP